MLGVVVDWALTILTMIALTAIFIDPAVWQVEEELFDAAYDTAFGAMFLETGFLETSFLLATLAIVAGAYVGARRAATLQLKYGLVIAVTSGLTGLVVYLLLGNGTGVQTPAWYDVTGWIVLIPAGVLGGYLAKRRDSSTSA